MVELGSGSGLAEVGRERVDTFPLVVELCQCELSLTGCALQAPLQLLSL